MKISKGGRTIPEFGGWRKFKFPLLWCFFLCFCSFLTGFFGSILFSLQDQLILIPRFKPWALKAVAIEIQEHKRIHPLTHGVSGEDSFTSVSFQVASFLLYLSDVEEGGETVFPFENGMNMDPNYDYSRCDGLKVKPTQRGLDPLL